MVKQWRARRARKRAEFEQECAVAYARQMAVRAFQADPTMSRVFQQVYAAMMNGDALLNARKPAFEIPAWAAKEDRWTTSATPR